MAHITAGVSEAETARRTGIPRSTIRTWIAHGPAKSFYVSACDPCPHIARLESREAYSYLLGLYLGDGCISSHPNSVFRLRVALDMKYPGIIEECRVAMASVYPSRVGLVKEVGCVSVGSYAKHWPCLFPQHGPGPKHRRRIVLEPWQRQMAIVEHPQLLLRGLIHSDGCRGLNTVRTPSGIYSYPRYFFSNRSDDIRNIFADACRAVGVEARQMNRWNLSVAKRSDVERLDQFIGPKY